MSDEGSCDTCGYIFEPFSSDSRDFPILVGLARNRCEECVYAPPEA